MTKHLRKLRLISFTFAQLGGFRFVVVRRGVAPRVVLPRLAVMSSLLRSVVRVESRSFPHHNGSLELSGCWLGATGSAMVNTDTVTDGALVDLEKTFVFVGHSVLGTQRVPVDAFAAVAVRAATHRNALDVQYADLVLGTLHSIAGVALVMSCFLSGYILSRFISTSFDKTDGAAVTPVLNHPTLTHFRFDCFTPMHLARAAATFALGRARVRRGPVAVPGRR